MKEHRDLEEQWRRWAQKEPVLDERQLKRNLLDRISDRRSKGLTRLVLVAAAASVVALLIGIESTRQPVPPQVVQTPEVVYETGANVILVLREGADPICVVTESADRVNGDDS